MKCARLLAGVYFLAVLSRLLPHPPDFTPTIVLGIFLVRYLSKRMALLFTLTSMCLADALLAWRYGYPWMGSWTFFTYTGLALITVLTRRAAVSQWYYALFATCCYWLWTNFGVWLLSSLYPHNVDGLIYCYIFALPFLYYGIVGTAMWYFIIFIFGDKVFKAHSAVRVS